MASYIFYIIYVFRFTFKTCPLWKKGIQKPQGMETKLYINKEDMVFF